MWSDAKTHNHEEVVQDASDDLFVPVDGESSRNLATRLINQQQQPTTKPSARAKIFFCCVGVVSSLQILFAANWYHSLGVLAGLVFVGHAAAVTFFDRCHFHAAQPSRRSHFLKVFWFLGFTFLLLLLLIHGVGEFKAPALDEFPQRCTVPGCARVSIENPQVHHLTPVAAFASLKDFTRAMSNFTAEESNQWGKGFVEVYHGSPPEEPSQDVHELFHWRAVSSVFGFPDDLYLKLTCDVDSGNLLIEGHSSLRIGYWDFGVNQRRLSGLWHFIRSTAIPALQPLPCVDAPTATPN